MHSVEMLTNRENIKAVNTVLHQDLLDWQRRHTGDVTEQQAVHCMLESLSTVCWHNARRLTLRLPTQYVG